VKVLVTGSEGFVGRHVVKYLSNHGHEIIGTDIAGGDNRGSVADKTFAMETLAKLNFEAVVHLAGIADLKKTIEDPYSCYQVNCFGTLNMLELAVKKRAGRFVYACYDEKTRIFTTNGVKRYTELNVGDLVITLNSSNGLIETRPVKRIFVYSFKGKMIHFLGKRIDLLVTPNHNMLIQAPTRMNGRVEWRTIFEEAESVAGRAVCRLTSGEWQGYPFRPGMVSKYKMKSLIDLFYLTGLFVGDGNLNGKQFQVNKTELSKSEFLKKRDENGHFTSQPSHLTRKEYFYPRIFLSLPRGDKCRPRAEEVLRRNNLEWSDYPRSLYLTSEVLYPLFLQCYDGRPPYKPGHSKRIPRWMLNAPPKYLCALLMGLLDADGSRGRTLTTVSTGLVDDTMELCAKTGKFTVCSLEHKVVKIKDRVFESKCYRVEISSNKGTPMFGLSYDNIHWEQYVGNVFCIEVENHNFLVERNGKIAFSGNSSANVYGAPKKLPVDEEAPMDPRVPYDYSKVMGESLVMSYHRTKNLPAAITRAWLLFGEHDLPNRAVPRFISACLSNEPIKLFNSGRDTTAPSHALNYGKLVKTILEDESAVGKTFNFGGQEILSIRELAERIKKLTGSRSELVMLPPRSEMEKEPQVSYPSIERIGKLGYKHELTLDEGLGRTMDWMKRSAGKG
jgi:nucleoside-diphosphate-sugar epimerase